MSGKFEFRGISKRARELLAAGENKLVDYKDRPKGLHAEDLVAFANSERGGAILIGVEEGTNTNGSQIGVPCGCNIGDNEKLQIVSKSLSCNPPVQIELFVENLSNKAFYRIEIPTGSAKPYATNSGTYKIRTDGRNQPLHPQQLLAIFLDREGEEFRSRFSAAAGKLQEQMDQTLGIVDSLESAIEAKIHQIESSMGYAEMEASSARSTIDDVDTTVSTLLRLTKKDTRRIESLMSHLEAEDPVVEDAKKEVFDYLVERFREDSSILKEVEAGGTMTFSGGSVAELDKETLSELLTRAVKQVCQENEGE